MSRSLDGIGNLPLVRCTCTSDSSRKNLAALGNILLQLVDIFVVDVLDFVYAEAAYLSTWSSITSLTFHDYSLPDLEW